MNFPGMAAQMTEFRVIVTGLPPSASWQDLKDHMRKAGEPTYTDVVSPQIEQKSIFDDSIISGVRLARCLIGVYVFVVQRMLFDS